MSCPGGKVAQVRHAGFDHEAATRGEVRGDIAEAGNLRFLRGEVVNRVEHQVGRRERAIHPGRSHVADRDADSIPARPTAQIFCLDGLGEGFDFHMVSTSPALGVHMPYIS
jgi:hypothetical protein